DLLLLNVLGLISQLEGDFDRAYLAYSRMDALWVSSPEMISANANLYISFITSFLNACLAKGRYNEFRNLLSNLKTVRFEQESSAFMLQEALLYLEAVYCLNRAEYDKGIALGPEIEQLMRKHRGRIDLSRIITFYFNLCSLHFMKGQYSKANRWLTQLLQLPSQDYRRNVVQAAPVFQLLLFIAMDDRELLASRMRARLRARAGEPPSPLEAAIMAFATQFLKGNESQIQVAIAQFKQALMELMEAAPGVVPCAGECFFWAEGRLNGKLPGDMFKEYAAAQTKNGQ
ncbi:MAG TPA: hypothetical protein VHS96_10555, partial [Bacteroidia bacterium]|nr:hypothetical protein [Bacteroidia bacterium]